MRHNRWYKQKLIKYFEEHFAEIEDDIEFYPNPTDSQWMFVLPDKVLVILSCLDDGKVLEKRYPKG